MKTNNNVTRPKVLYRNMWYFVLLIGTPLFVGQAEQYLRSIHVSTLFLPFLLLVVVWAPLLIWDGARLSRTLKQEKQAMQARFDAQDMELFGKKLEHYE